MRLICKCPIACEGLPVLPDDMMFGDAKAVIAIPAQHVDEVAEEAVAMEEQEESLKREIETGSSISGVYPPNEKTLPSYRDIWPKDLGIVLDAARASTFAAPLMMTIPPSPRSIPATPA